MSQVFITTTFMDPNGDQEIMAVIHCMPYVDFHLITFLTFPVLLIHIEFVEITHTLHI